MSIDVKQEEMASRVQLTCLDQYRSNSKRKRREESASTTKRWVRRVELTERFERRESLISTDHGAGKSVRVS